MDKPPPMSDEVAYHIASLVDVHQVVGPLSDGLLLVSFARAQHIAKDDRTKIGANLQRLFGSPVLLAEDEVDIALLSPEDLRALGLARVEE